MEEMRPEQRHPVYENDRGTYVMSSRDLCMIGHLDKLADAGVNSFKIEGRMKGINYVAGVVKTYREALDSYSSDPVNYKIDPNWMDELKKVSNRGYTTFKFLDKNIEAAQSYDTGKANITHDIVGIVKEIINSLRHFFITIEVSCLSILPVAIAIFNTTRKYLTKTEEI